MIDGADKLLMEHRDQQVDWAAKRIAEFIVRRIRKVVAMVKQDLILLDDVWYFGRLIRRGATFKQQESSRDWYELWENDGGILMHCPAVKIHFTAITNSLFVKQYADAPKEINEVLVTSTNTGSPKLLADECLCEHWWWRSTGFMFCPECGKQLRASA